ncbi:MAG: hypothetical protein RI885_380 [Actinomycetota bacterium]
MRVGVDIGGTKTDAVLLAPSGEIVHRLRIPTGFGPAAVVDTAAEAVRGLAELAGLQPVGFDSIGVGVPGRVDGESGRVAHAVNLGLEGLDLGRMLGARFGAPVRVENDVNAAALGAFQHLLTAEAAGDPTDGRREDRGIRSMAYLNLGTGLAAGIVVGGQLWRGAHGAAGEIGHIPVDPAGPLCRCGQRGCLETLASGSAVARDWPSAHARPIQELFDAAGLGDPEAIAVSARLTESIASAVRLLVLTVDVDVVVVGGGLSSLGERLLDTVRGVLASWATDSPFLASLDLASRLRMLPTGFPAAAVGAALVGERSRTPVEQPPSVLVR